MVYHQSVILRSSIACLLVVAACAEPETRPRRPDAGFSREVCQGGQPFALGGRFGVLARLNVHINALGLVDTDAAAEILLLLDVEQQGMDVRVVRSRPCALKVPDVPLAGQDKPVQFDVSQRLIDSIRPVEDKRATLDGTVTCAAFVSEPITLLIGARLSPPTAGTLPEADAAGNFSVCQPSQADCYDAITNMCACDQEQDGKPGATLGAANVPGVPLEEVYVNLRATFALEGEVWSSDRIEGGVDASLEQGILGCRKAGNVACSAGEVNTIKSLNPKITQSEQDPSTFRAIRVAETTSCTELIASRDMLFPR
jgi:hypothetical protein